MAAQYDIDTSKEDIKNKADKSDLKDTREILEKHYAKKFDLNAVSSKFNSYAKISVINDLQDLKDHVARTYL
jgi:hypothetical protein